MPEILNRDCECWEHNVSLVLMNRGLVKEVVRYLYCPRCSQGIIKNAACMLENGGWLIELDPKILKPSAATARFVRDGNEALSLLIYSGSVSRDQKNFP